MRATIAAASHSPQAGLRLEASFPVIENIAEFTALFWRNAICNLRPLWRTSLTIASSGGLRVGREQPAIRPVKQSYWLPTAQATGRSDYEPRSILGTG